MTKRQKRNMHTILQRTRELEVRISSDINHLKIGKKVNTEKRGIIKKNKNKRWKKNEEKTRTQKA